MRQIFYVLLAQGLRRARHGAVDVAAAAIFKTTHLLE